jgi:pSer/pThr/pTyr-binding forkhead associated (FHA) protein
MSDPRFFLKKSSSGNEIAVTSNLAIGRSADSGIVLTEGKPSRNHARISLIDGAVWLEDLNSTNGTFVNGTRVDSKVKLSSGDKLRFDVEEFVFRMEAAVDQDKTDFRQAEQKIKSASGGSGEGPGWLFGEDKSNAGNKTVFLTPKQLEEARKRHRHRDGAAAAVGSSNLPQLLLYDGDSSPVIVELRITDPNKRKWTVGRDEGRNILIDREGVSGLHATIENSGKVWKVVDEISFCGTFVNGNKVMTSFLQSGDRIAFGPAQCEFRLPVAGAAGVAGAAAVPRATRAAGTAGAASASVSQRPRRRNLLLIAGAALAGTLLILAIWRWLG